MFFYCGGRRILLGLGLLGGVRGLDMYTLVLWRFCFFGAERGVERGNEGAYR